MKLGVPAMEWHMFKSSTPHHRLRHKLQKRNRAESVESQTGVHDTSTSPTQPLKTSLDSDGTRFLHHLVHFQLRQKRPLSIRHKSSSVLRFKAIRYPPEAERCISLPTVPPSYTNTASGPGHTSWPVLPPPELRHLYISRVPQRRSSKAQLVVRNTSRSTEQLTRTRRAAKTPVFAYGDLEKAHARRRNQNQAAIASPGFCKEIIEPADGLERIPPPPPPPPPPATATRSTPGQTTTTPPGLRRDGRRALRRRPSRNHLTATTPRRLPDDVEPGPEPEREMRSPPGDQGGDMLSLQICLDLLTAELSTAITSGGLSEQLGSDVLRLELWVMIETFGRLRDQLLLLEERVGGGRAPQQGVGRGGLPGSVRDMFDVWVRALQSIYENFGVVEGEARTLSDRDVLEGLGES